MIIRLFNLWRVIRRRKEIGFGLIVFVLLFSVMGNAIAFYVFDRGVNPDMTIADAFWYSIISITTIGYGDFSATTLGARIGTAVFVVLFGLTAFTSAVGIGVEWIVERQHRERTGMGRVRSKGHLLIINPSSASRARKIIEEFTRDSHHRGDDIVVVSDRIESLPFDLPNVSFIQGSPLEEDTYLRANLADASKVMVLGMGYDDPNSDSLVSAIVSVVEYLNPAISGVAECQYANHAVLFKGARNITPVFALHAVDKLMVQDVQDPGVQLILSIITSNVLEGTLASTTVETAMESPLPYREAAKTLLNHDINLVGVIRNGIAHLSFRDVFVAENDAMFYIATERHSWKAIQSLLVS